MSAADVERSPPTRGWGMESRQKNRRHRNAGGRREGLSPSSGPENVDSNLLGRIVAGILLTIPALIILLFPAAAELRFKSGKPMHLGGPSASLGHFAYAAGAVGLYIVISGYVKMRKR